MKEALESNPRKRRDRLHIIAEILTIANNGSLKTKIMYKANLSWAQLNEYLSFLLETKLVSSTTQNQKPVYTVTSKGMRYLRNYAKIKELLKSENERRIENNSPVSAIEGNYYKIQE